MVGITILALKKTPLATRFVRGNFPEALPEGSTATGGSGGGSAIDNELEAMRKKLKVRRPGDLPR